MTRRHKRPRLNAFERLPEDARAIVQSAIDRVAQRLAPQAEIYDCLCADLRAAGVPEKNVPAFSSFNRLVLREGPSSFTMPGSGAARLTDFVSSKTLRLVAETLRSIAHDLDQITDGETPSC